MSKKPRMAEVDGDKLIDIIEHMANLGERINEARNELVLVTVLLHELIGEPPSRGIAALKERVSHGT
jgi:hypothetical protein